MPGSGSLAPGGENFSLPPVAAAIVRLRAEKSLGKAFAGNDLGVGLKLRHGIRIYRSHHRWCTGPAQEHWGGKPANQKFNRLLRHPP